MSQGTMAQASVIVRWSSLYEVPGDLTPRVLVQSHLGTYQPC